MIKPICISLAAGAVIAGRIFAAGAAPALATAADPRPNIILIMTDDQGYGDLGFHGNPVLETPHLDALARGGATMKNFYVSPVCSPTRASLLTGRYNYRTRVVDTFKGRSMMAPDEVTVAEVLRDAGYGTGIFGKWHLGDNYPLRATDQGFAEALTIRGGGLGQPSDPIENNNRYTDPIVFHNNRQMQAKGYCTDVFFNAAKEFIDQAQRQERPFFAYITPNAPHTPLHDVPPALYAKYRAKDLTPVLLKGGNTADVVARIYAMVENIDENVGRLMAHLAARGLLDNTLVIFMCDNGPQGLRYVGPMRGEKSEVLDGGIRSPFYVHWPARLKAGAASDRLAAHIDVMPTLLAAAQVAPPVGVRLDGRSLLPLLEGRDPVWPERAIMIQSHRGDQPQAWHHVAVITQQWKLLHSTGRNSEKLPPNVPFELYNLPADPLEQTNLLNSQPAIVGELREAYETWFNDVSATRPDNYAPPRIIIGTDHETTTVLTPQDWRGGAGWLLHAAQPATYTVELRWPQPVVVGTVEITAGALKRTWEVPQPMDRLRLEDIRLPAGDIDFSVMHLSGTKRESAYQATLIRQ
jgi:arylsulfatase/arylsulfatase A